MTELDGYCCSCCGEWHEGLPLDFSYDRPDYWNSEYANKPGCFLSSDLCVIEDRDYFVRGIVEIPVIERQECFQFGVWVSLSKRNFDRMVELWDDPGRVQEEPYFGWFSNSMPNLYPETLNLKTNVRARSVTERMYIELQPTEHPLSIEQLNGITIERVRKIAEIYLHSREN